ncbi:MAG: EAL domain-containing protein, partial [Gammaproteobacteria bacterium]|nr:EAL domain-containing protein [Gammaproteobacteria bacterium]
GYSSLSYLHRFPADTLKIDRSFVSRMDDSPECSPIIQSIMSLANNLKMDVIAEGPETAAHVQHLQGLNCDYGQGYFFSRPVDASQVEQLLSSSFVYAV